MKTFKIPVEWTVTDIVEVEAETFIDAVQYVIDNADEIPLGTEPNYIDGSWKISAEAWDEELNAKQITEELEQYYRKYCEKL